MRRSAGVVEPGETHRPTSSVLKIGALPQFGIERYGSEMVSGSVKILSSVASGSKVTVPGCRFDLLATKWDSSRRRPLDRRRLQLLLGIPAVMHHLVQHGTPSLDEAFTWSTLRCRIPLRRRQIRSA